MRVWVVRSKRGEFRYFLQEPTLAGPNEARGHYERTDTWQSDIDYSMQSHEWIPDEPPIPVGTWYVRMPSGEVVYGKRLAMRHIPPIRRKIMTHCSPPITLDLNYID